MDADITVAVRIDFDIKGQVEEIKKAVKDGLKKLTEQAYEEWQNEANRKLKTTRRRYQDSLHFVVKNDFESEITLYAKDEKTNWLVTAIEQGAKNYSIRKAVLGKAKKHWPRDMSEKQRRAMFGHLARVGRLGRPPVPFTDIPFRTGGGTKEKGKPNAWRRISQNTPNGKWDHPGFKPLGGGGPGPLRPAVMEYIKKTAGDVFIQVMSRFKV